MGRVRTNLVKRSARNIIEKYYLRLTMDFDTNKKVCDEIAVIPTKRLRNKIAGYITHLMKRISRGSVRGISLKLQEEERERKMDFIPPTSAFDTDTHIAIDQDTDEMLRSIEFGSISGVTVEAVRGGYPHHGGGYRGDRERGDRERKPRRTNQAATAE